MLDIFHPFKPTTNSVSLVDSWVWDVVVHNVWYVMIKLLDKNKKLKYHHHNKNLMKRWTGKAETSMREHFKTNFPIKIRMALEV